MTARSAVPPAVSVVCATYRRPDAVRRLLRALEAQDLAQPFEVVLSDDGSGPDVQDALRAAVAESSLDVRLLAHEANRGPGAARNDGWRAAGSQVIAFTDDDCQPDPGWLRAGLAAVSSGDCVVVGRVEPDPAQAGHLGPWSRTLRVSDARYFQTANAFYQRADLERVGGFDPAFVLAGGEDTDLGLRVCALGRSAVYSPEALVLHDVRAGRLWALVRETATKWVDLPLVLRKHPGLRDGIHHRVFWKRTHPSTIAALTGLAAAPLTPWSLFLTAPYLRHRLTGPSPLRARLTTLPGRFLVDSAEVVACVRGSVRHRSLLL